MTCTSPMWRPAARTRISTSSVPTAGFSVRLSDRTLDEPYMSWTIACIVVGGAVIGWTVFPRSWTDVGPCALSTMVFIGVVFLYFYRDVVLKRSAGSGLESC